MADERFVFLGYRAYDVLGGGGGATVRVEPGSGLGILRDEAGSRYAEGVALESLDPALREKLRREKGEVVERDYAMDRRGSSIPMSPNPDIETRCRS